MQSGYIWRNLVWFDEQPDMIPASSAAQMANPHEHRQR
jgi:hypothetical protein